LHDRQQFGKVDEKKKKALWELLKTCREATHRHGAGRRSNLYPPFVWRGDLFNCPAGAFFLQGVT